VRFINLFLIGYCVLIAGLCLAMWQLGVFRHVAPIWLGIGVLVAVGLGIMMSVRSGKPTITEEVDR
jgi:hypothetical protein